MNKSYILAKLCFGLSMIAILLSFSTGVAAAQKTETIEANAPPACQQFSFSNQSYFRSPASAVVTGDFNNDSIPDIVALMSNTNSIAVALGNTQNGFETPREFIAGVSPQHAAVGDFNRDGEPDLAVTSAVDQQVNILLGDGTGNFNLTDSYPVGRTPIKVVTADFNNDGWLDLAVGNTDTISLSLSIYLGGANGFLPANPGTITLNGSPRAFAAADFNRDGKIDIITVAQNSFGDSYIRLLNGNGQGGFTNDLTLTVGELYTLAPGDFNNDNYPDFATFGYRDARLRVYLNNRTGGFDAPLETVVALGSFQSLIAADFNSDGKTDLTTGGVVLLNNGNANFTVRENAKAFGEATADFNGDGILDLAGPSNIVDSSGNSPSTTFSVAYGLGEGQFEGPTFLPPLGGSTWTVTSDFNNDGRLDIAAASTFQNQVRIAFQNADGSFASPATAAFTAGGTSAQYLTLAAGDFNSDGSTDLAMPVWWTRGIYILTNNGSGQFTSVFISFNQVSLGGNPDFVQPGDFNNDGKIDLVVLSRLSQSFIILLNNGSGVFTPLNGVSISNQNGFYTVAVGDYNSDGKNDLAITRGSPTNLLIFHGNGDGTFAAGGTYEMSSYTGMVRSGDLNGDNRADLIVTTGGSFTGGTPGLVVLIANSTGGFTQTSYPVPAAPNDVTIGDFNGDTIKDFLVINSPNTAVTLFTGNGSGSFTAQNPVYTISNAYTGTAADFNQDQKLDLVLAARNGATAVFYNNTPKSPCLTVNDVQVAEGNSGTTNAQFTVSLSAAATQTVAVDFRVVRRSAREDYDFNNVTGRLEFLPGTQTQTVSVPVRGDVTDEIDETFQLVLSNSANASLTDNIGVATITDDDAAPTVSMADASIVEGSGGTPTRLVFNASLSAATGRKAKVGFTILDGTAMAGSDFNSTSGTIVFNADEAVKQTVVEIYPDVFVEPDETFKIKLSNPSNLVISDDEAIGTIVNDDFGGTVEFEAAVVETGEASETVVINVRRTGGNAGGILLEYSTSNGTATANQDYLPKSGKMVFDANETLKTIIIPILNDAIDESPLETVNLTLRNISGGAVLGVQSASILNIADDDPAPMLSFAGTSVNEGNSGTTTANFNVRLLAVSEQTVRVNFATADGTATAPDDYQSASGTLIFAPGETSKTISVSVRGDTSIEPDETFFLNLSSPVNVVLQNAQAIGTIVNDDSNARRANGDFDGDGKTDLAVFRPSTGGWFVQQSSNNVFRAEQFGNSSDTIAAGDYDGDGKTDIAVYRPSTGSWYILESRNSSFRAIQFGISEDKAVAGDYDGDGKTDIAVYRPSVGSWYVLRSFDNSFFAIQWGSASDKPVPADFDGDGKTDVAVYRSANGTWYRLNSSNNQFVAVNFGINEDKPVAADYDGDNYADIAVFRPSNGNWYLLQSTAGFNAVQWGTGTDQPAPGDFDGDGRADIAVFRPNNGHWYLTQSSSGQRFIHFGTDGDIPVPSGYLPN